ncbi:3-carboxyethylcatechol 2,3-dioxygenase [Streptomyces sp. GQFP]|uniref:3-carboxyethylcatechol 2,3-dioxygenase n=1 Tax=Streptomyces sp. GQFP TaxID=2907545 RepID=UPI001F38F015|nr:3-carboxyethylcatechol 2,3-dioxygenase [Streptomyces sp. GQFP]UIX29333.1 3-carboxyethylcatechol 2,3-dioxygenase [Streptomyces sp. GQFP]
MATEKLVVCASHSPGMERDEQHVQGLGFRAGLEEARRRVADFAPDCVVLVGGDHRRTFREIVPAFAVALSAGIMAEAGHPSARLKVPEGIARGLVEDLLAKNFDVSVCRDVEFDHAFAQPLRVLLGGLDVTPVVPVAVNCATPPLPSAARVLAFGRAIGGFLDRQGGRVLVIGSGGLSHSPPSLEVDTYDLSDEERARLISEGAEAAKRKVRPEWDQALLRALADWDEKELVELVDHATERAGVGGNEVRTWLTAAAAGGVGLETIAYEPVPDWITGMGVAASTTHSRD